MINKLDSQNLDIESLSECVVLVIAQIEENYKENDKMKSEIADFSAQIMNSL